MKKILLILMLSFAFHCQGSHSFTPAYLFAFTNQSQTVFANNAVTFNQVPQSKDIVQSTPTTFTFNVEGKYLVKYQLTSSLTTPSPALLPFYQLFINGQPVDGTEQGVIQGSFPNYTALVQGRGILRVNQGDQMSLVNIFEGALSDTVTFARIAATRIADNH